MTTEPTSNPRSDGANRKRKKGGYKQRRAGRLIWFRSLLAAGKAAEAQRFTRRHRLRLTDEDSVALAAALAASQQSNQQQQQPTSHGGAGVSQRLGRENWDKTTQNGQNLQYGCTTTQDLQNSQCSPVATADAVPLAVEADLTRLAAKADCTPTVTPPAGESEGERGFGQAESMNEADNAGVTDKIVSMWPKVGEAIVGKLCRNKQYNELRVVGEDGREMWTKVGNWLFTSGLIRGERVLVRKIWGSGDDTDAEYEVVRRLDVNEPAEEQEVPQPESGSDSRSDSGSESVAPIEDVVAHESAIREQQTPKASLDAQQTPVAILPQFQREEPDYPRKPESGEDYIARIRAEAAMWANGQGR